jgi:hypothetical protein
MSNDPSISPEVAPDISRVPVEEAVHSSSAEVLLAAASNPSLNEDLALTLLKRNDLSSGVLERLSKNATAMKSRKVKLALVENLKTPRHIAVPILRHLFTFDLMRVALTPAVPADVKAVADETLCNRMETITTGEKLTLAHRASGRVAAELLSDSESRVIHAALENSRLTEAHIIKAVTTADASTLFVQAVSHHAKWSLRREVRIALLRSQHTPLARALEFAQSLPVPLVKEVLHGSRLPSNIKEDLLKSLNSSAPR